MEIQQPRSADLLIFGLVLYQELLIYCQCDILFRREKFVLIILVFLAPSCIRLTKGELRQQSYLKGMNKISTKNEYTSQFSPWEESFIDLVRSMNSAREYSPKKHHYMTLEPCKGHSCDHQKANKRELGRTSINMSKINLQSDAADGKKTHQLIKSQSRRYEGPRLTFYSKMNPKCSGRSKLTVSSLQKIAERSLVFQDNLPNRMVRDESIKYLDIRQDSPPQKHRLSRYVMGNVYPFSNEKNTMMLTRRHDDHNMRRLKLLYNTRKNQTKN